MERLTISHEISRILNEYNPFTTKFELENWVQDQLEWCYTDTLDPELFIDHIKFQGAYIKFLSSELVFNLTKVLTNSEVVEYTIPLKVFLLDNYGVDSWDEKDCGIRFASCDFELMSMQITEIMVDWCTHVELVNTVETAFKRTRNQRES